MLWWHQFANWLYFFFGVSGTGSHYGFWSGSGSDIGEYTVAVGIFLTLAHAVRSKNCEVKHCWRLGGHATAAGHRVCRRHHPDPAPSAKDVAADHYAARADHDQVAGSGGCSPL